MGQLLDGMLFHDVVLLGSSLVGLILLIVATHWGEVHETTIESLTTYASQTRVSFPARLQSIRLSDSTVRFTFRSAAASINGYSRDFNVIQTHFQNESVIVTGVVEHLPSVGDETVLIRVIRLDGIH